MSSTKIGILIFAVAGCVLVLSGAGVLALANRDKTTAQRSSILPDVRPAPPPTNPQDEYVKNHHWWAKPLTQRQLDEFLALVVNSNAGTRVFFDRRLRTVVHRHEGDGSPNPFEEFNTTEIQVIIVNMSLSTGVKRWTREHAIRELSDSIDVAEFKYGRARR